MVAQQSLIAKTHNKQGWYLKPHAHHATGILKRHFHAENSLNVFRPHYAGEILRFENTSINAAILNLCFSATRAVGDYYGYRDVIVFVRLRFPENVFVHTKTQSRRFQIPPV